MRNIYKKVLSALPYLFFLLCLSPIVIFSYKHPSNNWDMLGYIAIVIRVDGTKDIKEIHRLTYTSVKEIIPEKDYKQLVGTSGIRLKFANDPSLFKKILPIHVVKPLYTWFVYCTYKVGFTLPAATVVPSLVAYLLIGLLLFHWLKSYLKTAIAFFAALLIMTSVFMIASVRNSSPDTLSAFFLFSSFYFILKSPNIRWLFLFLLLSLLTRADNIITALFVLSFLTISNKWEIEISKRQYFLMVLALAIAYLIIILPVREFGWNLFYYSEYSKYMDFNRDFEKPYTLFDYFSYMRSKAITGLISTHFTFFMFLVALIIFYRFPIKLKLLSLDQSFALLLVAIIVVRFVLLPDLSDRFNIASYLCLLMILTRRITRNPVM